jgi:uncharacterized protein (DUF924 family)
MRDIGREILSFWLHETPPSLWFRADGTLRPMIETRFSGAYDRALDGHLSDWVCRPETCLALCLLLGQFPAHLFYGTARVSEAVPEAVRGAKMAVAFGFDQMVKPEGANSFMRLSCTASR